MVTLDDAVIARLESHGTRFEVLVDSEIALKFREEKGEMDLDLGDLMAAQFIFEDAGSTDKSSEEDLVKAFGSTDLEAAVRKILLKGDLQLTTDQRRRMVERKRRLLVNHIARNAINPQNGAPHPAARIEAALEEARMHIDPFKSVDAQVQDALKLLRPILPIRFENVSIAIKLPPTEAGKAYAIVKGWGDLKKEEWLPDGSWVGVVELPAGMQTEFYSEINNRTHGNAETRIVK